MLRFKNELREKDLIFAFVHQESAHLVPLLKISMRQKGAEKIELDVTVRWQGEIKIKQQSIEQLHSVGAWAIEIIQIVGDAVRTFTWNLQKEILYCKR